MTTWLPELDRIIGPRYLAIADALAADIRDGRLTAGARLPTHRDLAWKLGVTVGTVSRAYAEAERRGLVGGTVGRGTFVRAPERRSPSVVLRPEGRAVIELGVNRAPVGSETALFGRTLAEIAQEGDLRALLSYQPHVGREGDRDAVAAWLRDIARFDADADRLVLTDGAQHAMTVAFSAITRPGDAIGAGYLTYPGLKALAALLDLRIVPLAMDDDGVLPEAFEAACREQRIRALYVIPNLQNPTSGIMPEARRRRLAAIAEDCDVPIVEDDVYGFLLDDPPPPVSAFTRTHAVYASSASKSLAPGLRIGWLHLPADRVERAAAAMRATSYTATPTMAEIVARWIRSGEADRLVAEKRRTAERRQGIARRYLGGARLQTHPRALHLWMTLPEAWRADDFAAAARRRNVSVTPAAAFFVGRGAAPEALRICIGGTDDEADLVRGLEVLASLLADVPQPYLSII